MNQELLDALKHYIDIKVAEGVHRAVHRSGSSSQSEDAWKFVEMINKDVIEQEKLQTVKNFVGNL